MVRDEPWCNVPVQVAGTFDAVEVASRETRWRRDEAADRYILEQRDETVRYNRRLNGVLVLCGALAVGKVLAWLHWI